MQNYDFRNLNDKEFEILVNDLLSVREGGYVDRYKAGKDGGVDGRFFTAGDAEVIIQSKHWLKSGIKPLIQQLKKVELPKIKKLSPQRYIIATSLELSLQNKKDIKKALEPFIISEEDILGQENINDLLSQNEKIENKHYKLWLSSSSVLKNMLNAALTGRSEAKFDEIKNSTKMYVVTNNHNCALEKLEELHSVIITGEAGIGKTTLAEQLAHHYMRNGFELCVISGDISEAEKVFSKDLKQIFYFDDFLGRNYLMAIEGHKDSQILSFIDRISKDNKKRFILTSRTTVLGQGKRISDLLRIKKIDQKEYELTIQSLSKLDKAKILYNHIWHSDLREEYIEQLYINKRYLDIVKHRNYNPRLISFITDPSRLTNIASEAYWAHIEETLDNPKDVWADVFDNQLDDLTRAVVCLTVFNGAQISEDDLYDAFFKQALSDGLVNKSSANHRYTKTLKSAVGSMLNRILWSAFGQKIVKIDLFNPSVGDFILWRYVNDRHSLEAFYSSLDTVDSLQNLISINNSTVLKHRVFLSVLRSLIRNKVNKDYLENKTAYFLRLASMAISNKAHLLHEDLHIITSMARAINSIPVPVRDISDACVLLEFLLSQHPNDSREIAVSFIENCSNEALSNSDYVRLNALIGEINGLHSVNKKELSRVIKGKAIEFWESEFDSIIASEGLLDGIMDIYNLEEAEAVLYDYLIDELSDFDLSDNEIEDIIGAIDIEEYIQENIDNARDDGDYNPFVRGGGDDFVNEDEQVDDLFSRE